MLLYCEGDHVPFLVWLESLKDSRAVNMVRARINRIRLGNFGDCRAVGEGVEEFRIDLNAGYRVYFGRDGMRVVILLCGGIKRTQGRDILRAQRYWKEYGNAKGKSEDRTVS